MNKKIVGRIEIHSDNAQAIYCDNEAAIYIAHNPVFHDKVKQIEVNKHFRKENIEKE